MLLARRRRAASRVERRGLDPVLLLGGAIVALGGVFLVVQDKATQLAFLSAFALLPGAFVLGLVRSRFFRTAAVGRLIEGLAADHGAAGVRDALRAALGDPTLAVAYWLPEEERYVDGDGAAIALPPPGDGRAVTEIGHGGRRVGALVHAAALRDEPELLGEAASTAALAIENGRLEAELRARLEALRASRARIVEAGDAERRRLTRDLHDGAQQRLVSLKIDLQLARERVDEPAARELLDRAVANADAAVEELRDLASGIHPAVLAQRGLDAAIEALATRSPVPVEFETELGGRLPSAVETAAYFVDRRGAHERRQVRRRDPRPRRRAAGRRRARGRGRGRRRGRRGARRRQWAARARRPRGRARRLARGRERAGGGHAGARPRAAAASAGRRRGRLAPAGGRSARRAGRAWRRSRSRASRPPRW